VGLILLYAMFVIYINRKCVCEQCHGAVSVNQLLYRFLLRILTPAGSPSSTKRRDTKTATNITAAPNVQNGHM